MSGNEKKRGFRDLIFGERFLVYCHLAVFFLLIGLECFIGIRLWGERTFWIALIVEGVIAAENAIKMFVLTKFSQKIGCYVVDFIALLFLTLLTSTPLVSTLCMVILSEFYLSSERFASSLVMAAVWEVAYLSIQISYAIYFQSPIDNVYITGILNDMAVIAIHFVIMACAMRLYQKNIELRKTMEDLGRTNRHLEEAYEKLAETTAIEERQKIARDIHDTAGHSITTVIMQTEAARLIIDKDPAEAKKKIIAANLQAKNALEELRTSVHLLSGRLTGHTLKELLERIVADTSNGTDVVIRADIEDVTVGEETAVFLCNALKEGLANGMRHGGATAFLFELGQDEYALSFLLSDNGTGTDTSALEEGFGLTGMRKQAEALGGIMQIFSQKGEGFEIEITLPVKKREDNDA